MLQACIDQAGDINASLRALPIFLLASQNFVVFAGSSYTHRLWCVLEMFTFLRSGGTLGRVIVKPLDLDAAEACALFDIRHADCYVSADKQRLLAIVESSYGSFEQFNSACKQMLLAKLGTDGKGEGKGDGKGAASSLDFQTTRTGLRLGRASRTSPAPDKYAAPEEDPGAGEP